MSYILRRRKLGNTSCKSIAALSKKGLRVFRNDALPPAVEGYVFRWGCTSNVNGDRGKYTIVNDAQAIHWCADKRQGRLDMQADGIAVPETWGDVASFERQVHPAGDRFVVRPKTHSQGRNLVVGNAQLAANALRKFGSGYISRLIPKTAEYRVYVIQGRVACVAKKTPGNPDQVAWNVAQGGRFDNVRWDAWPIAAIVEAIKVAQLGKLDFCGVDVMTTDDGKPYVLEVNSAPSLTSEYRQQCFAKAFDYIVQNGKERLFVPDRVRNWKDCIHPAVVAA